MSVNIKLNLIKKSKKTKYRYYFLSYFVISEQKVINNRWAHSNIDGSKDKRFKDNFSVKTFKIGRIVISIKNKSIMNICFNGK